jgi:hypothetical protein
LVFLAAIKAPPMERMEAAEAAGGTTVRDYDPEKAAA